MCLPLWIVLFFHPRTSCYTFNAPPKLEISQVLPLIETASPLASESRHVNDYSRQGRNILALPVIPLFSRAGCSYCSNRYLRHRTLPPIIQAKTMVLYRVFRGWLVEVPSATTSDFDGYKLVDQFSIQ
jgi:hypothetical protein